MKTREIERLVKDFVYTEMGEKFKRQHEVNVAIIDYDALGIEIDLKFSDVAWSKVASNTEFYKKYIETGEHTDDILRTQRLLKSAMENKTGLTLEDARIIGQDGHYEITIW